MSVALSLPSAEGGLRRYLTEIRKYPLLGKDEEYMLAKRWREHEDPEAAHRLVTSHLRLSAKIALSYRGYGLPLGEVISEGNLGLMHAVKKFDPDKGFRLATYAIWWIRAAIQEYILRSWSLVKLGTSAVQKKLFFNLRRAKARISALSDGDLKPDQVKAIASRLGVNEEEVVNMDRRLASRDASLNSPLAADAEQEWLDVLEDEAAVDPEAAVAEAEERALRMDLLAQAMQTLNARERRIFTARRLQDPPALLEDLAKDFGVSRERVRQIEVRAFEKVQAFVTEGEKRKLREKRRRRAAEVLIARRTADAPVWATA
ncbi:RNA polymerase sigma 32 subunit(heat shock sigma factor) (plasmid) [Phenylobacterium zucineum HLK1]|uniref:RNA polymerase sigma factor RpoH n=1 Tax=Phenylobacterium zucineum (strain HLK1) TaxID=450851 RepID=B4RIQ5_PHEZH|nr:RNA polymerase sigma 32 subunit(heat shock sigma factor) [Phenylobacterium zucineum HLK1]